MTHATAAQRRSETQPADGGGRTATTASPPPARWGRATGVLVALGMATAAGALSAWWMPRGPVTTPQALCAMGLGLAVGLVAGAAWRSRWVFLVIPAVLVGVFELGRVGAVGPTVDAPALGTFYGLGAFVVGRFVHALLVLVPLLLGLAWGRSWAGRLTGEARTSGPTSGWARVGRAVGQASLLVGTFAMLVLAVALLRPGTTQPVGPVAGSTARSGGVAELALVDVRGHDQWVLLRGADAENPVLLFLAGGPGGFEIGTMAELGAALERDFVVATWEQRGTGKSYAALEPAETLTFDSAVRDTVAMAEHLRERFGQQRIYLVGNSYGTLLGVRAVQERPDLFHAYVGTGQMVDVPETDRMFYEDTLADARRTGDAALVDELRANGAPPYEDAADYWPLVNGEHVWNDYSGIPGYPGLREPDQYLTAPEYTLLDKVRAMTGLVDTNALVYPELETLDLRSDATRLDVPVYLVAGAHEARGRAVLAEEWFQQLRAPVKEWVELPLSGHRPFAQQPRRFATVMRDVLAATSGDDVGAGPGPSTADPPRAADAPRSDLLLLFSRYNPDVWPMHVVAYVLGLLVVGLVWRRPGRTTDRVTAGVLAGLWLWLGVVFHGIFAAQVSALVSAVYGALFVVQAVLLLRAGVVRTDLRFARGDPSGGGALRGSRGSRGRRAAEVLGWTAIGYALLVYPLLGVALGHGWPESPLFGMAPCPTAIVTFGLLLLAAPPLPRHLLLIPLLWAVLAPLAAVPQGAVEDLGLLVIGVAATTVVLWRDRSSGTATEVLPAPGVGRPVEPAGRDATAGRGVSG